MDTSFKNNKIDPEKYRKLTNAKTFLGKEFLTWLWYGIETHLVNTFTLSFKNKKYKVDIWIDDRLALEPSSMDGHESLLKGGDPSKTLEAKIALQQGKWVKEIRLGVEIHGLGEFHASLSNSHLSPKNLQIPRVQKNDLSQEFDLLSYRIHMTEWFLRVLDFLFDEFMTDRVDSQWTDSRLPKIRHWIGQHKTTTSMAQLLI